MNGTLGIGKIWSNTARHPFGYGNDVDGDDCFVRSSWIITALQPSTDMSKSKAVLEIVMMVVLVLWRNSRINMI